MMHEELRRQVCKSNKRLADLGLVVLTWGNVSAIDRTAGVVAIKPSGVDYGELSAARIALVDMDGNVVEGRLKPSVDLATHLELYRAFEGIGSVVHTHSKYATMFAQAETRIDCFGTTHSDYFHGRIPVTRMVTPEETREYEANIGRVIVKHFRRNNIDFRSMPACLVGGHGPFVWASGAPDKAVENALALEQVAEMAYGTLCLKPTQPPLPKHVQDLHYLRKHGPKARYGQQSEQPSNRRAGEGHGRE